MYQPFESLSFAGRCVSVIGSGGKTTFLRWLSARLDGTVILTTSTKILPFGDIPLVAAAPDVAVPQPDRLCRAAAPLGQTVRAGPFV